MPETINEHDFIELNYTGKLPDGTVFDTTEETVAKENDLPTENRQFKPAVICVGEQQILPGLDAELVGKEIGKDYTITLPPEKAFGKRDIKKMKIIPSSTFKEHKMDPRPGLQIEVDGEMGTVTRVAGGRIIVNFNHPLAGREVIYQIKINRKVTDQKEQITTFLNTTLRIPLEQIKVEITDGKSEEGVEGKSKEGEKKAIVEMPMQLPPQFTDAVGKKLAELVKLKSVEFKTPEKK